MSCTWGSLSLQYAFGLGQLLYACSVQGTSVPMELRVWGGIGRWARRCDARQPGSLLHLSATPFLLRCSLAHSEPLCGKLPGGCYPIQVLTQGTLIRFAHRLPVGCFSDSQGSWHLRASNGPGSAVPVCLGQKGGRGGPGLWLAQGWLRGCLAAGCGAAAGGCTLSGAEPRFDGRRHCAGHHMRLYRDLR